MFMEELAAAVHDGIIHGKVEVKTSTAVVVIIALFN